MTTPFHGVEGKERVTWSVEREITLPKTCIPYAKDVSLQKLERSPVTKGISANRKTQETTKNGYKSVQEITWE